MKTAHYYLLYDEECSLCRWYTKQFIRFRFLNSRELIPYQKGMSDARFFFDTTRARAEIALVSDREEKVRYGLDSLLFVIGRKWSWMERIGRFFPIYLLFTFLYKFISYNRKIIAPSACSGSCSCDPPFNLFWRLLFIAFFLGSSMSIFHWIFQISVIDMLVVVLGLFLLQAALFWVSKKSGFWNYAGFLALLVFYYSLWISGLALVLAPLGYFLIIMVPIVLILLCVAFMLQHDRRIVLLGSPHYLTLSWFLYSFFVTYLFVIL